MWYKKNVWEYENHLSVDVKNILRIKSINLNTLLFKFYELIKSWETLVPVLHQFALWFEEVSIQSCKDLDSAIMW